MSSLPKHWETPVDKTPSKVFLILNPSKPALITSIFESFEMNFENPSYFSTATIDSVSYTHLTLPTICSV